MKLYSVKYEDTLGSWGSEFPVKVDRNGCVKSKTIPETPLDYKFVPYEEVVRLHEAYPTNPRAFVRALEVLTYQDQVYELQTAVNKRLFTLDRVEFIRKVGID